MKIQITLFASLLLLLISCDFQQGDPNEEIDEGQIENSTYHSDELGWTMEIPDGYAIGTLEQTDKNTVGGSDLFGLGLGAEDDSSNNLLSFHKGLNHFSSVVEPWVGGEITWTENNAKRKELMVKAFQSQEVMSADISDSKVVNIDGVDFEEFTLHFYYSDAYNTHDLYTTDDSPISKQVMYSAFINGYDFLAVIFYENEKEKNAMMASWMNSKFE